MNNKFSPPFDDALLKSLAQRVDDHRADLINRCLQVLHETLLTNRSEMRSDELARIATAEADALIYSLRNSLSFVKEHGAALCEMGLSRQTVFGLLRAIREFLIAHFENDFVALNIYTSYHIMALDGFLESNEKRILSEQEGIRHAFQIALDNSTAKISESEERYRSLVELSPVRSEAFIRSINDSLVSGMIYQIYRMKDGSRKFTYLSDSVQRMYGITPQDGMENSDLIYGRVHKEDRLRVWQEEEQANQTLSVFKTEVRIMNPDGSIRWSSLISTPRRLEDGSTYWDGIELDITERKQMETALRESETRFSSAFHASPVAQTITALESGLVLDVNEAFSDLMGYTYDELIGLTSRALWMDFNDRQKIAKQLSLDGAIHDMEMPLLNRSGQHRIVLVSMAMIELKGEKCIISTLLDITERKKIEQELHIKDRALATSVNAVIITALDGKAIFANDVLSSMFGYSREEILQLNAIDLAYDSVEAHQVLNSLYSQGFFMSESIAKRKDGSCFPIQISASLITDLNGQPIAMMASFIDISERRRAEKKLRGVEEFQRILLNATESTAISLFDCAGTLLSINELGAQRIGKRPNELVGLSIHDIFPKEIADRRKERIDEACRTAAPVSFEDSRQSFQYETTVYPILDATGKATRVAAYARDITERKRNERLLRESEQRYYVLAEASHDMIFVVDRDDKITYVNHYAAMQLGVQPDALIGQARSRWFGQFDSEKMGKSLKQVIETGKSQYEEVEIDFPHGTAYLSTWLVPLKDQSGAIDNVMGVSRDISKLKKMEYLLKKTNLELESKVENRTAELRDSRDRLRELSQKIITTQEEERRRVSRELHDDAGQALIGLRFSLDSVYKELPANLRKLRQRMAKALTQTDQTIQRIRTLAYNLRPPTLDLVGINLGIKELCREFSDQTGLKVEYSGVDLEGLHDEISISLYRFVQETLTNVVKHAGASKVQVTLEYQDEMIKVSVQDNGQGISAGKENAGLGMVGIKERFDTLGGALEVKPVTPKGTLIQVCLPWKDIVKM